MKQKRTKPRPTRPKGKRWPPSSLEELHRYVEDCTTAEHEDWIHDCEVREYKKSEKFKQAQQLAEKFKNRVK